MRTRHPFPDVVEQPEPEVIHITGAEILEALSTPPVVTALDCGMCRHPRRSESGKCGDEWCARHECKPCGHDPERFTAWHIAENRRQRRKAVATFVGPKEFGKGLRRKLVKQRQRNKTGKMKGKQR